MDQKEIKLLSVLLINGGVFYIQRDHRDLT